MTAYDIAAALPPIDVLRSRCRGLAAIESILDLGEPYYAYDAWGDDAEAALMSNGSGDEYVIVFTTDGAFIRVFDHESPMSPYRDADQKPWPGLLDGLPDVWRTQIEEPAFGDEFGEFLATAVLWRGTGDNRWHTGAGIEFPPPAGPYGLDIDGTGMLEILLDDIVDRYVEFATDYYEIELDRAAVAHVIEERPLTDAVIQALTLTPASTPPSGAPAVA